MDVSQSGFCVCNLEEKVEERERERERERDRDIEVCFCALQCRCMCMCTHITVTVVLLLLGYLKLFQLSPVDFANEWDILLVDEAQDLTPAIIDLIKQTKCAKIFVGDPHQQIYSFRGATGAMPLIRAHHTFYLTRVSASCDLHIRDELINFTLGLLLIACINFKE